MSEHRKLMRRVESPGHARFLTFSCYRRLPLLNNDAIRSRFVERLGMLRSEMKFQLFAWVLMPEHVHLLILPDPAVAPVARFMRALKGPFAQMVIARWRELNASVLGRITDPTGMARFWQSGGGYDRNILYPTDLLAKVDYMHGNPIARGLCLRAVDWRWSSARWHAGMREGELEMDPIPEM